MAQLNSLSFNFDAFQRKKIGDYKLFFNSRSLSNSVMNLKDSYLLSQLHIIEFNLLVNFEVRLHAAIEWVHRYSKQKKIKRMYNNFSLIFYLNFQLSFILQNLKIFTIKLPNRHIEGKFIYSLSHKILISFIHVNR